MAHILHLAIETAATQTKPASAGYKTLDFWLVRAGRLSLYMPLQFYSEGLVQNVSRGKQLSLKPFLGDSLAAGGLDNRDWVNLVVELWKP